MLSREATNINFSLWLTRLRLEPTIYRTRGEHANRYTTDAVQHHRKTVSCANSQLQLLVSCFIQQNFLKSDFAGRNGQLDYRIIATVPFIKMRETLCMSSARFPSFTKHHVQFGFNEVFSLWEKYLSAFVRWWQPSSVSNIWWSAIKG